MCGILRVGIRGPCRTCGSSHPGGVRLEPLCGFQEGSGGPYAAYARDGKPVRVAVTAGLDDDTYTEIVKGELKADDQVIIAEQRTNSSKPAAPRLP